MGSRVRYVVVGLYEPTNRPLIVEVGMEGEERDSVLVKAYNRRNEEHGVYKILGTVSPRELARYGMSQYDYERWVSSHKLGIPITQDVPRVG